jgi:hypothetical protein
MTGAATVADLGALHDELPRQFDAVRQTVEWAEIAELVGSEGTA